MMTDMFGVKPGLEFSRPHGTQSRITPTLTNPAMNRWAFFFGPYGTISHNRRILT